MLNCIYILYRHKLIDYNFLNKFCKYSHVDIKLMPSLSSLYSKLFRLKYIVGLGFL